MLVRFVGPFFLDEFLNQKRAAFGNQLRAAKLPYAVLIMFAERNRAGRRRQCEPKNFAGRSYRIGLIGARWRDRAQRDRCANTETIPHARVQCSVLRSHSSITAAI